MANIIQRNSGLPTNNMGMESFKLLSKSMQRQASRELERVIVDGLVGGMHEEARGFVGAIAMQNAGALSNLADHLSKISPSGSARCNLIADAYAFGAAHAVARF